MEKAFLSVVFSYCCFLGNPFSLSICKPAGAGNLVVGGVYRIEIVHSDLSKGNE
jgi:hypothetical protein